MAPLLMALAPLAAVGLVMALVAAEHSDSVSKTVNNFARVPEINVKQINSVFRDKTYLSSLLRNVVIRDNFKTFSKPQQVYIVAQPDATDDSKPHPDAGKVVKRVEARDGQEFYGQLVHRTQKESVGARNAAVGQSEFSHFLGIPNAEQLKAFSPDLRSLRDADSELIPYWMFLFEAETVDEGELLHRMYMVPEYEAMFSEINEAKIQSSADDKTAPQIFNHETSKLLRFLANELPNQVKIKNVPYQAVSENLEDEYEQKQSRLQYVLFKRSKEMDLALNLHPSKPRLQLKQTRSAQQAAPLAFV